MQGCNARQMAALMLLGGHCISRVRGEVLLDSNEGLRYGCTAGQVVSLGSGHAMAEVEMIAVRLRGGTCCVAPICDVVQH